MLIVALIHYVLKLVLKFVFEAAVLLSHCPYAKLHII